MSVIPSSPAGGAARRGFRIASAGLGIYAAGRSNGYSAGRRAGKHGKHKGNHGKSILFWIVVFLIILAFFHP